MTRSSAVTSSVVTLSLSTFDEFINTHDLVMVAFTACSSTDNTLLAKYEQAAIELKDAQIPLAKVDSSDFELCLNKGITEFPTFKLYRGRNSNRTYNGPHTQKSIVSYMKKHNLLDIIDVTVENFEETRKMDDVIVVAYLSPDDKRTKVIFTSFADKHRGHFVCGISYDTKLAQGEGVDRPSVVVYKAFNEEKIIYPDGRDYEGLDQWFAVASKPLIGEINEDTYSSYQQAGIPLAHIVIETKEERTQLAEQFMPLAKSFRGTINVGTIDSGAYQKKAAGIKPDLDITPWLMIEDFRNGKTHVHSRSKPLDMQEAARFIQEVVDSTPHEELQPIPPVQNSLVSVVKEWNYREIVMESTQDVFIGIYAPWCPHCQALGLIFYQLGSLYAAHSDRVTIAKIDGTIHDVPAKVDQLPTFLLYPANAKSTPLDCSEYKDLEDFVGFIKEKGSHHVDVSVPSEWKPKSEK